MNSRVPLQHHFRNMSQQRHASTLGMWAFLATEILFFGGVLTAYMINRWLYAEEFMIASHHLILPLGGVNTLILLGSSLTMALAVQAAQLGDARTLIIFLLGTIVLGAVFLGIKGYEYYVEYQEQLIPVVAFDEARWADEAPTADVSNLVGRVKLFFLFYFFMTLLHALHMVIGLGALAVLAVLAWRRRFSSWYYTPVELTGLYWHFVDVVWIFLFPLLYLIGTHDLGAVFHP